MALAGLPGASGAVTGGSYGYISGTVTDAGGGAVSGATVTFVQGSSTQTTQTQSDGTYTSPPLLAGSASSSAARHPAAAGASGSGWEVEFTAAGRATQWWQGVPTQAQATPVGIAANTTTPDINATLATGGSIAGTVTDRVTGGDVGGVTVDAYDATSGDLVAQTVSGGNGTYALSGLPVGSYEVDFVSSSATVVSGWYANAVPDQSNATVVAVTGAQPSVSGIDVALHENGQVTGTVSDGSGPLGAATVALYDASGNAVATTTTSTANGSTGTYAFQGVTPGRYRVGFTPPSGSADAPAFYADATTLAAATPITVSLDTTTSGIDQTLASSATISGLVSDSTNPSGLCGGVDIQLLNASGTKLADTSPACSGMTGSYSFSGLAAGTYTIHFVAKHAGPGTAGNDDLSQYLGGGSTLSGATMLTVTAGQTTGGQNAQLQPGARITGTITDALGRVLPQTCDLIVAALDPNGNVVGADNVYTNTTGNYALEGLPTGSYTVQATCAPFFGTVYYPASSTRTGATAVAVTAPNTASSINMVVPLTEGVEGQVTSQAGQALSGITVEIEDNTGRLTVTNDLAVTDANGRFLIPEAADGGNPGPFVLAITDTTDVYEPTYLGSRRLDQATQFPLNAGQPLETANATLTPQPTAGTIAGTVTGGSGGLSGITVTAYGSGGTIGGTAVTASDGTYAIGGLAPGTWTVEFSDASGHYVAQYYDDASSAASATPVTVVSAGSTTPGINAQLATVTPHATPNDALSLAAPGPAAGSTARSPAVRLALAGSRIIVHGRRATVTLRCAGAHGCRGTLTLRDRSGILARLSPRVHGRAGRVSLRLSRRLARHHHLTAALILSLGRHTLQRADVILEGA